MATASSHDRGAGEEICCRVTKEGRNLKYCLNVIQQPERARACGSGAKSSADRRPVDPPPVVELRIFDITAGDAQDVTFSYDANFFLFATLEVARNIAHGRLPGPAPPQIPVLTGMPVSGMAYLDRPAEAGYFIFPDLSVRHEGRYNLSFNLYEETKNPKDADAEAPRDPPKWKAPMPGAEADSSFDWRMEIKSKPFTVFSAKKFPGLTESTALSKTVAEQGCRVRIRRDVRMRRRDGKDGMEYKDFDDDYVRPERMATPADHNYNGAMDYRQIRSEETSRRQSLDYAGQGYPQAFTPSSMSSVSSGHHSHGSASGMPGQMPNFQQGHSGGLQYHRAGQYRQPPTGVFAINHEAMEKEHRRSSIGSYGVAHPPGTPRVPSHEHINFQPGHAPVPAHTLRSNGPSAQTPMDLTHFKHAETSFAHSPPGPLAAVNRLVSHEKSLPAAHGTAMGLSNTTSRGLGKRPYDSVFDASASTQPLFNGRRPSLACDSEMTDDDEAFFDLAKLKMNYKRADGTRYTRAMPGAI